MNETTKNNVPEPETFENTSQRFAPAEPKTSTPEIVKSWYRIIAVCGTRTVVIAQDAVARTRTTVDEENTTSIVVQSTGNIIQDFRSVVVHLGGQWTNLRLLGFTDLPENTNLEDLKNLGFNQ